jgi:hypothetical protein
MRPAIRRPPARSAVRAVGLLALVTVVLAACGDRAAATPAPSASSQAAVTARPAATPTAVPGTDTPQPQPTEVPGGSSFTPPPGPLPGDVTTTETPWGTILDAVPSTFPVFPRAVPAEPTDGPASAAFLAAAAVDVVATWYTDALEALGFSTLNLSTPLEDGSRVLDTQGDLPECWIRTTFRPAGESTMITVLYAAGCAGGGG